MLEPAIRSRLADGYPELELYPSVSEFVRGLEKNSFSLLGGLSYPRLALAVVVVLVLELGAWIPLAWPGVSWSVRAGAAAALVLTTCGGLLVNRWLARSASESLLWPMAIFVLGASAVHSAWLALRRGGIVW